MYRYAIWTAAVLVVLAAVLLFFSFNGNRVGDDPGRPVPHALDQS